MERNKKYEPKRQKDDLGVPLPLRGTKALKAETCCEAGNLPKIKNVRKYCSVGG